MPHATTSVTRTRHVLGVVKTVSTAKTIAARSMSKDNTHLFCYQQEKRLDFWGKMYKTLKLL